ncbi:MAG: VanW family protein, partial [Acidimicrobiia bacterium]|nr:VanW family protein [Acidimicrobiia bacterium]
MTFTREDLVRALRMEIKTRPPASFRVWFDAGTLEELVEPVRAIVEQPPRNAEVIVDEIEKVVTVIPGRSAVVLDSSQVLDAVMEGALSGRGTALLPYAEGEPPEITKEDIAEWGPLGLVSSFTTNHPCCADRVHNIHLFAEIVDGAVVMPGEEFSLNGWVGERTVERGFRPAPTIIRGELEDTIGGGVSQFATTFYNAVFHGCYEDVSHKPHTYYFSRYPEVSEATINWPNLDLVFRNDSDAPIWIKTNYTGRSITVEFYGNTGGRTCERVLGNRRNFTSPKKDFVGNPEIPPGEEKRVDKGFGGWTNSVKRIITWPDGTTEEQTWTWSYRAQNDLFEVHPCMLPGAEEECPIQVPTVVGKLFDEAKSQLQGLGFKVAKGPDVVATNETQDGKVASRTPADKWLVPGTTITLNVYE